MDQATCASCKRVGVEMFEVSRRQADGTVKSLTAVCSLLCLYRWTHAACIAQGVRLVTGVQSGVQRIKQFLKGG